MRFSEFIIDARFLRREIAESTESADDLLRRAGITGDDKPKQMAMNNYVVRQITYAEAKPLIIDLHYTHRMPSVSFAYGLFRDDELVGAITYGVPGSPNLCSGICGPEYRNLVIELNRVVLKDNLKNEASMLVGRSLKLLSSPRIVVSYADTAQGHIGYVYQACNFLFTGTTKPRTDIDPGNGKHSRNRKVGFDPTKRVARSAKHRYVIFVGNRREVHTLRNALRYEVLDYPKPATAT